MTAIATVTGAIATIGAAVTGIVSADDPPQEKLDSAQMPALYVLTGAAEYDTDSRGVTRTTRRYRVRVAVAPTGQATPPLLESRVRVLIPLLQAAYVANPTLNRTVLTSYVLGDSGITILPEYNAVGFEMQLEVRDI